MINEGQVPPALFLGKPGLKSRFDSGSLTGADIDYLTKVMRFRELQDASNADYGSLKLELPLPSEVHPASSHAAIEERMYDYFLENVVSRITSMLSSGMVSVSDNFLACKAFLGVPERIMGSFGFDTHDFSGARGKKFLVLGSGSRNSPYNRFGTEEPWLCRYVYYAGGEVVGLDIAAQTDEKFRSYAIDLADERSLSFLPSGFFDFVVCTKLVDFADPASGASSPMLQQKFSARVLEKMAIRIMDESSRVLAPGGKMAATFGWENRTLEKRGNQLVLPRK